MATSVFDVYATRMGVSGVLLINPIPSPTIPSLPLALIRDGAGGFNTSSLRTLRILKATRLLKLLSSSNHLQILVAKATKCIGES